MRGNTYLITGGLGYIGSVLTEELRSRGANVVVVDNELVAQAPPSTDGVEYVVADVRRPAELDGLFAGVDGVVHLAAIVGDVACDIDPELTRDTNVGGTVAVAEACRSAGVRRMVFASTCSGYGLSRGNGAQVSAALRPLSLYAETKVQAEQRLAEMRDDSFAPCILRLATIHGVSPRMRFDLAVNGMTARAAMEGKIQVFGGQQWRPFLHVRDAARAMAAALTKPPADGVELYNCGSDGENHRLLDVGLAVGAAVPNTTLTVCPEITDPRDYRVSFAGTAEGLGFSPRTTVCEGIGEIRDALLAGQFRDYVAERYHNHLLTHRFVHARAADLNAS